MNRNVTALTAVVLLFALTGCGSDSSDPGSIPNGTYRYFHDLADSMPELMTEGRVPEQYQYTHDFIIKGDECRYKLQNLVIKPVEVPCTVDTEASTITVDLREMSGDRDEDTVAYRFLDDTLTLILNGEQRSRYEFEFPQDPDNLNGSAPALEVPFTRVEK